MGAKLGQQGLPCKKKRPFSKIILDHMKCQKRCVLSSWWFVLALLKFQKALKMGSFGKKRVKNGSKRVFYKKKKDPRPFAVPKQVKKAHFQPTASHFGHSKITKCLENGSFYNQKWVTNASKMCFFKNDPRPFGLHKQMKILCTPPPPLLPLFWLPVFVLARGFHFTAIPLLFAD